MISLELIRRALPEARLDIAAADFAAITTDSRQVKAGELFLALPGEKFDGHTFCRKALEQGAAGIIISKEEYAVPGRSIVVRDTLEAYQRIARAYRRGHKGLKVVAITGSNGKTSTKDLIAACLAAQFNVVKTYANYNNEIGLPRTLLDVRDDTEIAVVEMGMRGLGQIRAMKKIAEPDIVVITNVGETHMELLGSMENIARAKSEILEDLTRENIAVLNGDDRYVARMTTGAWVVTYGIMNKSCVQGNISSLDAAGTCFTYRSALTGAEEKVNLPMIGEHNVMNALAAVAVAESLGVPDAKIALALETAQLTGKRQEISKVRGITLLNDAYNASPASMRTALNTLEELGRKAAGRRIAVLADMLELGALAEQAHRETGEYAAAHGVDLLIAYGTLGRLIAESARSKGVETLYCASNAEAAALLAQQARPGDVVLLKGSHSMEVDRVGVLAFGEFKEKKE